MSTEKSVKENFKVTLVPGSYTDDPVKAIWFMWEQSRCDDSIEVMETRYKFLAEHGYPDDADDLRKAGTKEMADFCKVSLPVDGMYPSDRFKLLLQMDVPIMETIKYSFMLENIPVSFREQLVRHRIGSRIGPNAGVDDEPGIPEVTYWSQTSRVRNLQNFVSEGNFFTPELDDKVRKHIVTLEDNPLRTDDNWELTDKEVFLKGMKATQWTYRELIARGYKPETAREVLPSCTTHRITWTVNLKSIKHIFGHRTCWIAFAGYWHPIIHGVLHELVSKVNPIFHALANPPCIDKKTSKFKACIFEHENKHRMPGGNDPGIPCSLWIGNHYQPDAEALLSHMDETKSSSVMIDPKMRLKIWEDKAGAIRQPDLFEMVEMMAKYGKFWNRDPLTGNPY